MRAIALTIVFVAFGWCAEAAESRPNIVLLMGDDHGWEETGYNGRPPEVFQGESSEIVVTEALRFIDRTREGNQPFFTIVWFGSPHEPYSGLPADLALYDDLPAKYPTPKVSLTSNETGGPVSRP